jgi:hypothetical protein
MMKPILAAAFVLTATTAALAQTGINPGTVVGNVYDDLTNSGYSSGFGYSPPASGYDRHASRHHHSLRERVGAGPRLGNGVER